MAAKCTAWQRHCFFLPPPLRGRVGVGGHLQKNLYLRVPLPLPPFLKGREKYQERKNMLYNLLVPLAAHFEPFNLFRYLTFRSGGAVFTSLIISFYIGPKIIRWLKSKQAEGQPIRLDGPETHLPTKKGTPTMGGVMILLAGRVSPLLWAAPAQRYF